MWCHRVKYIHMESYQLNDYFMILSRYFDLNGRSSTTKWTSVDIIFFELTTCFKYDSFRVTDLEKMIKIEIINNINILVMSLITFVIMFYRIHVDISVQNTHNLYLPLTWIVHQDNCDIGIWCFDVTRKLIRLSIHVH